MIKQIEVSYGISDKRGGNILDIEEILRPHGCTVFGHYVWFYEIKNPIYEELTSVFGLASDYRLFIQANSIGY